jgi:hypothetical protein
MRTQLKALVLLAIMLGLALSWLVAQPSQIQASAIENPNAISENILDAYSGSRAAQWALANVFAPKAVGYTDYTNRGGDCTNFVSHTLRAGGWTDVGCCNNSKSSSVWWQRNLSWFDANIRRLDRNSYSWTFAPEFGQFILQSKRGSLVRQFAPTSFSNPSQSFRLGDVVQIVDAKGTAFHTMLVTDVTTKDVRVTYRNAGNFSPQKNISLYEVMKKQGGVQYRHFRIH